MTSSMQLAQECLQQDAANAGNAQPLEAVELFAQTIDSSKTIFLFIHYYTFYIYLLYLFKTKIELNSIEFLILVCIFQFCLESK